MPALPLETSDMLNSGLVSLARELAQAGLVDQMSAAGIDADRANMRNRGRREEGTALIAALP